MPAWRATCNGECAMHKTLVALASCGLLWSSPSFAKASPKPQVVLPAATHNMVTVAGEKPQIGDGGLATSALLNLPGVIAFDPSGNLYISEGNGNRVRKVDPVGIITTFAGTGGSGFNGDGIPATEAQLSSPRGLLVHAGDLYIVENASHRVRKVSLATGSITTLAGTGVARSQGDFGPATEAQLNGPGFVDVDSAGNFYISEVSGQKIRKVDTAGTITTVAGTGV